MPLGLAGEEATIPDAEGLGLVPCHTVDGALFVGAGARGPSGVGPACQETRRVPRDLGVGQIDIPGGLPARLGRRRCSFAESSRCTAWSRARSSPCKCPRCTQRDKGTGSSIAQSNRIPAGRSRSTAGCQGRKLPCTDLPDRYWDRPSRSTARWRCRSARCFRSIAPRRPCRRRRRCWCSRMRIGRLRAPASFRSNRSAAPSCRGAPGHYLSDRCQSRPGSAATLRA